MMKEIERKFLVFEDRLPSLDNYEKHYIQQAYLSKDPKRTVRIRRVDKKGFITIKGQSDKSGLARFEFETEITGREADDLLELCLPGEIHKTRFKIPFKGKIFELDIFHKKNSGLILAEVELASETEEVALPDWIDREVTGDPKYYNSHLSS